MQAKITSARELRHIPVKEFNPPYCEYREAFIVNPVTFRRSRNTLTFFS